MGYSALFCDEWCDKIEAIILNILSDHIYETEIDSEAYFFIFLVTQMSFFIWGV